MANWLYDWLFDWETQETIMTKQENTADIMGFKTRERIKNLITLTEGDILVSTDGSYHHVTAGEVSVLANGEVIESKDAEMAEVSIEAVQTALATGNQIFNLAEITG